MALTADILQQCRVYGADNGTTKIYTNAVIEALYADNGSNAKLTGAAMLEASAGNAAAIAIIQQNDNKFRTDLTKIPEMLLAVAKRLRETAGATGKVNAPDRQFSIASQNGTVEGTIDVW